jgi:serine/threonine-protein phosphatase 4 catalytic subunit
MEFDEHMNRAFKIFEACPQDVRNQPDKKPAPEYFL